MRPDIIIAENFYADPDAIVEYALSLDFIFPYNRESGPRDRVAWRASRYRSAKHCPFKSSETLIRKLEDLVGEQIDRRSWNADYPIDSEGYPPPRHQIPPAKKRSALWNCSFHVKHHAHKVGEGVHGHTDHDIWNAVGMDGWAGLIYLNKKTKHEAGLTTWKNVDPSRQFEYMTPAKNWRSIDYLSNVYNRIILVRGAIPHSGIEGWGKNLRDGRLFQTFFFRVKKPKRIRPIALKDLEV